MRARWFSFGAIACASSYSIGLALGQRLFNRSVIYPHLKES